MKLEFPSMLAEVVAPFSLQTSQVGQPQRGETWQGKCGADTP